MRPYGPGDKAIAGGWRRMSSLMLLLLALPALAGVVKIERVSPPPLDMEVILASGYPSISTTATSSASCQATPPCG